MVQLGVRITHLVAVLGQLKLGPLIFRKYLIYLLELVLYLLVLAHEVVLSTDFQP